MERIVRGRSATIFKTFYAGGVAADPTSPPTVTVTRESDGSSVATGAVVDETGTGVFSVTIPATSNTLLDTYTLDWSAEFGGMAQEYIDYVEVAGALLFTLAEARELKPLDSTVNYPDARIIDMRTTVETAVEEEYGAALVPRYEKVTVTRGECDHLLKLKAAIRSIRSVEVDGTALTAGQLADLTFTPTGYVTGYRWPSGFRNVVVGYEHGLDVPPARLKLDAIRLARTWLVGGPVDDRAATYNIADGGTYSLVVPGRNGSIFGLPDLDAAIHASPFRLGVA